MWLLNGSNNMEYFEDEPISLERTPELWLERELIRLHRLLIGADGMCRPHAVSPDGVSHVDKKRPWKDRSWAVFQRVSVYERRRPDLYYNSRQIEGEWALVRTTTKSQKPNLARSQKACPIQHTIDAAEKGARKRAVAASKKLGEDTALRTLVEKLKRLDCSRWSGLHLHLPPRLTQPKVRNIMVELLLHHQGGSCAVCRTELSGRITSPRGLSFAVLDHDHATDLVRGALCVRCNSAEGGAPLSWTPELELLLEAYRADPPAAAFGWYYGQPQPESRWW